MDLLASAECACLGLEMFAGALDLGKGMSPAGPKPSQLCKPRGSGEARPLSAAPAGLCGRPFSPKKRKPWPLRGIQPDWEGVLLGQLFKVKILTAA